MFVVPYTFPIAWQFTLLMFSNYWTSSSRERFKKPIILEYFCFSIFFHYYGNHFSNDLGIVWISASCDKCKKLITLECLCFPILFPYHGILLSTCFWSCKYLSIVIIVNILKWFVLEKSTWQRVRDNFSHTRPLKYIAIMNKLYYVRTCSK